MKRNDFRYELDTKRWFLGEEKAGFTLEGLCFEYGSDVRWFNVHGKLLDDLELAHGTYGPGKIIGDE